MCLSSIGLNRPKVPDPKFEVPPQILEHNQTIFLIGKKRCYCSKNVIRGAEKNCSCHDQNHSLCEIVGTQESLILPAKMDY